MGKNRFASKSNKFKSKQQSANSTNKKNVQKFAPTNRKNFQNVNSNNIRNVQDVNPTSRPSEPRTKPIVENVVDYHTHSGGMYPTSDRLKVTGFSKEDGVLLGKDFSTEGGLIGGSHDASGALDQSIVAFKTLAHGKTMAVTEHNTMGSMAVLLNHLNEKIDIYNDENNANFPKYDFKRVIHRINGVNIIPAVEITCVVPGIMSDRGKDLKVHMLVYGARFDSNGMFHRLLRAKHHNDLLRDQGLFKIIEKQFGMTFSEDTIKEYVIKKQNEVPGFGQFGPKNVVDFLQEKGISLPMTYEEVRRMLKSAPEPQRLQLSVEDVIKVAHSCGGICILAHPHINLDRIGVRRPKGSTQLQRQAILNNEKKKVVKRLLSFNIDGFEMVCNSATEEANQIIRDAVKECRLERSILYTAGSDAHFNAGDNLLKKTKLGRTKQGIINGDYQAKFFGEILKLDNARKEGKITHRSTPFYSAKEIENIVYKYEGTAKAYQESFAQGVSNFNDVVDMVTKEESFEAIPRNKSLTKYSNYEVSVDAQYGPLYTPIVSMSPSDTYTVPSSFSVDKTKNSDGKTK